MKQLYLEVTWLACAMKHQPPNEKQRLWRQTCQAISDGQATQEDVAGPLKLRSYGYYDDDGEVTKAGEQAYG